MVFREVERKLRANGWDVVRIKGSHYQFGHPDKPGVVTVPYHGNKKDISRAVLKNIEEGTGLSLEG